VSPIPLSLQPGAAGALRRRPFRRRPERQPVLQRHSWLAWHSPFWLGGRIPGAVEQGWHRRDGHTRLLPSSSSEFKLDLASEGGSGEDIAATTVVRGAAEFLCGHIVVLGTGRRAATQAYPRHEHPAAAMEGSRDEERPGRAAMDRLGSRESGRPWMVWSPWRGRAIAQPHLIQFNQTKNRFVPHTEPNKKSGYP
jgi:hypothetical protein